MSFKKFVLEERAQNGSFEEKLFIKRVKATEGNEYTKVLSEAMKEFQEKGLSYSEIKGAFEYAAATCGCFLFNRSDN